MQTYKYEFAIGLGVEIGEVPSLMCKWWFISQGYKIEYTYTYANVNFFNTCRNFQDMFFY
jgi:hypothetical protein